jgi:hypothetical protein
MEAKQARKLWRVFEPVHAVVYFTSECADGFKAVGLKGFWMGYFAGRSAPLGAVGPGPVTATFFNFHPALVARAIPDAWGFATPDAVLEARRESALLALRRLCPDIDAAAGQLVPILGPLIERADGGGRVLFSANRDLPALTYRDAIAHNMLDFFDFSGQRGPFAEPPELAKPLNPFNGPLPASSSDPSEFHPIAVAVPGSGPAPGAQIAKSPKHADTLIARHTKKALAEP